MAMLGGGLLAAPLAAEGNRRGRSIASAVAAIDPTPRKALQCERHEGVFETGTT